MGCSSSSYKCTITHPLDDNNLDEEWVFFQFHKISNDAVAFLDSHGKPTGNDGYWKNVLDDLRKISSMFPNVLFFLEENIVYETSEDTRYYAKAGKGISISPVTTWPEFEHEDMT